MENEWNGEGLPPTGCECELYFEADGYPEWFKIEWFGLRNGYPVFYDCKNESITIAEYLPYKVRPIKTQEDKEREEVVEAMVQVISAGHGPSTLTVNENHLCMLYDAGYRKQGDTIDMFTIMNEWHSFSGGLSVFLERFIITRKP